MVWPWQYNAFAGYRRAWGRLFNGAEAPEAIPPLVAPSMVSFGMRQRYQQNRLRKIIVDHLSSTVI